MVEVNEQIIRENGTNWLRELNSFYVHIDFVIDRNLRSLLDDMENSYFYEVTRKRDAYLTTLTYTKLDTVEIHQKKKKRFVKDLEGVLNFKELTNKEKKALALEVLSRY